MKRLYIITGAKGHLASTIIQYLRKQDCYIRGLILPTESGQDDRQITYYQGDVTKPETLGGIFSDLECNEVYVIHAAGLISIGSELTPRLHQVNVEGTKNIIDQCLRYHVRRLVYVSSVHAIPETGDVATITEAARFSKDSVTGAYAATKAEATQAVLDAAAQGLDAVVVHPSGILGPYDRGNNHMVQLIKMCISGKLPAGVTGGYDFVDVRDVAKGCLQAAERGKSGNCYILSNRYFTVRELLKQAMTQLLLEKPVREITVRELLDYVHRVAGGARKLCLPMGLARAFAPMFTWLARVSHTRPLYTRYALDTIASDSHFSHDKATAELGYHPRDMQLTVRDTISWLRGQPVPLEAA